MSHRTLVLTAALACVPGMAVAQVEPGGSSAEEGTRRVVSSVLIDPRIPSSSIPPAPPEPYRQQILALLKSIPSVGCPTSDESGRLRAPTPRSALFQEGLVAVDEQGDLLPTLVHLILTERDLGWLPLSIAVSVLAEMHDEHANRALVTIHRSATFISERVLAGESYGLSEKQLEGIRRLEPRAFPVVDPAQAARDYGGDQLRKSVELSARAAGNISVLRDLDSFGLLVTRPPKR